MQRYDSYKDSGIQWLGEIPSHWEVCKTSYIFNHIGSGTTPNSGVEGYYNEEGTPFLQTGDLNDSIVINTAKKITDKAIRDSNQKIYPQGSLVIAMYGATIGKLGILGINATVNQACCVLPETKKIHTTYAYYLFLAAKKDLLFQSKGGGQPNISQEIIKNEKIVIPPLPEQQAIASYLDTATAKIDEAIAQQQKMIDLLNERKQIIINNAVTKGLNPNAKMKPSGIQWLGEIPSHWETTKLKNIINNSQSGLWGEDAKQDGTDTLCIRVADFNYSNGNIRVNNLTYRHYGVELSTNKLLRKRDLLLEKSGGGDLYPVGRVVRYNLEDNKATCSNFIQKLTPIDSVDSDYIYYLFRTMYYLKVNGLYYNQTTGIQNLKVKEYLSQIVFLPPLSEQQAIASYLDTATAQIDEAISQQQKMTKLLQERKQIIINDVVTGKVKVV